MKNQYLSNHLFSLDINCIFKYSRTIPYSFGFNETLEPGGGGGVRHGRQRQAEVCELKARDV